MAASLMKVELIKGFLVKYDYRIPLHQVIESSGWNWVLHEQNNKWMQTNFLDHILICNAAKASNLSTIYNCLFIVGATIARKKNEIAF